MIIQCTCAECKKEYPLEVQDTCSKQCGAVRRERIRQQKPKITPINTAKVWRMI